MGKSEPGGRVEISPRVGKSTSEDILGEGGHVQWAVFNFEGLQFPSGGGGTKFSRGDACPTRPPLNETLGGINTARLHCSFARAQICALAKATCDQLSQSV